MIILCFILFIFGVGYLIDSLRYSLEKPIRKFEIRFMGGITLIILSVILLFTCIEYGIIMESYTLHIISIIVELGAVIGMIYTLMRMRDSSLFLIIYFSNILLMILPMISNLR